MRYFAPALIIVFALAYPAQAQNLQERVSEAYEATADAYDVSVASRPGSHPAAADIMRGFARASRRAAAEARAQVSAAARSYVEAQERVSSARDARAESMRAAAQAWERATEHVLTPPERNAVEAKRRELQAERAEQAKREAAQASKEAAEIALAEAEILLRADTLARKERKQAAEVLFEEVQARWREAEQYARESGFGSGPRYAWDRAAEAWKMASITTLEAYQASRRGISKIPAKYVLYGLIIVSGLIYEVAK